VSCLSPMVFLRTPSSSRARLIVLGRSPLLDQLAVEPISSATAREGAGPGLRPPPAFSALMMCPGSMPLAATGALPPRGERGHRPG